MATDDDERHARTPGAAPTARDQRVARAAAALRENLRKRKAQQRGRASTAGTPATAPPASAVPPADPGRKS